MTGRFPDDAPPAAAEQAAAQNVLADLRGSGGLAAGIPAVHGGSGGTLTDAARILRDCAARSGSAGLIAAMHLAQLHTLWRHLGDSEPLAQALHDLCRSGGLVASAVSEPRSGGDIHASDSRLLPDGQGFRLRKTTSNTSYVPQAAAFLVTAVEAGGEKPVQRLALAMAADMQATERQPNPLLGMRGIDNRGWDFDFVIPADAVLAEPFAVIASRSLSPLSHIFWAAVWSGIVKAALARTQTCLGQAGDRAAPDNAIAQDALSQLRNRQFTLNALIRDALAQMQAGTGADAIPFAASDHTNRLKIVASELATGIVLGCLNLCGIAGYRESGPDSLAVAVRDILSGPIMVSNARLQANTRRIERYVTEGF